MADMDLSADGLAGFDFDPRGLRCPYTSRVSWPIAIEHQGQNARTGTPQRSANAINSNMKRSTTPLQSLGQAYEQPISHQQPQAFIPDWRLQEQAQSHLAYSLDGSFPQQYTADGYAMPFQTSPTDYVPTNDPQYDSGSYLPLPNQMDNMTFNWQDFPNDLLAYPAPNGLPDMNSIPYQNLPNSPSDTALEVRSLSSSDNGWTSVDYTQQPIDGSYQDTQIGAIFNPEQTLHGRTFSDSSYSDVELQSRRSWGSYVDIPQHAIGSPSSDSLGEIEFHHDRTDYQSNSQSPNIKQEKEQPIRLSTSTAVKPLRIKTSSSPQRSPTSTGRISPPGRRQSKKSPNGKATKPTIRRQPPAPKIETEKRVGRRKGPLRPEQRKQASEIRKLGACIRCKFLKKTVSVVQIPE